MDVDKFFLKYEDGLNQLEKELDKFLRSLWLKVDHLQYGFKTGIQRWNDYPYILANFNDKTPSKLGVRLYYKEDGDSLFINSVEYDSDTCAYSNEVLSLKFEVKGKTDKEVLLVQIESIEAEKLKTENQAASTRLRIKNENELLETLDASVAVLQDEITKLKRQSDLL